MDVDHPPTSGAKPANSSAVANNASDSRELAWAFLGLLLWSAVVFGGIIGAGYVLGHALFHWW